MWPGERVDALKGLVGSASNKQVSPTLGPITNVSLNNDLNKVKWGNL